MTVWTASQYPLDIGPHAKKTFKSGPTIDQHGGARHYTLMHVSNFNNQMRAKKYRHVHEGFGKSPRVNMREGEEGRR